MQWFCGVQEDLDQLPALSMPSLGKPPCLLMLYKEKSQTAWLLPAVLISIPTYQLFCGSRNRKALLSDMFFHYLFQESLPSPPGARSSQVLDSHSWCGSDNFDHSDKKPWSVCVQEKKKNLHEKNIYVNIAIIMSRELSILTSIIVKPGKINSQYTQ